MDGGEKREGGAESEEKGPRRRMPLNAGKSTKYFHARSHQVGWQRAGTGTY